MIYSGLNYRQLQKRNIFSFDSSLSLNSASGSGLFGFSGENKTFNFKFQSGRILDPEDRYVFSYQKNSNFNISGNVSGSFFDYYIDDVLFCKSGVKDDFNIENFYLNVSSGLELTLGLFTNAHGNGDFFISGLPSIIYSGEPFSGKIIETGAGGTFDIFSGSIEGFDISTGKIEVINFPIEVNGTGDVIFSGNFNAEVNKEFLFNVNFDTSFGAATKQISVIGGKKMYRSNFDLINFDDSDFLTSGGNYNSIKSGSYLVTESLSINSTQQTGLPLLVKLKYLSGFTGNLSGVVTGSILTSSGENYKTNPIVLVSGIGGTGSGAKIEGLIDIFENVTGFKILNVGSGYSQNPKFIVTSNVNSIEITNSGSGYFSDPNFLISGVNYQSDFCFSSGFFNTDSLGKIFNTEFYNYGSGFTSYPNLIIYSVLSDLSVVSGGSGYINHVGLNFSGGGGSGISGSGLIDFRVYNVKINNSGSGYSSIPSVVFSGDEINKASGNAFTFNGFVTGVQITNQGLYKDLPIVSFSGGSPSVTGLGESLITGRVTGSLITSRGNNYLTAPTVTINSISGNGGLLQAFISSGASGNITLSTGASGSGLIGSYSKTFLNSFNLLTGTGESLIDFNVNNLTGVSGLSYESQITYLNNIDLINVNVTYNNRFDDFPMVVLLTASGHSGNIKEKMITGER